MFEAAFSDATVEDHTAWCSGRPCCHATQPLHVHWQWLWPTTSVGVSYWDELRSLRGELYAKSKPKITEDVCRLQIGAARV